MKLLLLYTAFVLIGIGCSSKLKTEEKTAANSNSNEVKLTDAQLKNAGIETAPFTLRKISAILKVNGKIDVPPQHLVSVSAPLGGYLRTTKLLPGMHVNKGEVIAVLEDPQYIQLQQDYLLAKSKLHFAELEYARQKELNQSQASSDKVTQQAESEMNNQRINMSALAQKLRIININPATLTDNNITRTISLYSNITGYVSKVNVNIGRYVNPADVLFELINPTDIHLNLIVYEKDIDKLYIGQQLNAYTNVQPDKKYPCEVLLISKDVTENGSTEVHCHFENYDKNLLPGMYMNADIAVSANNSKTLPEQCVVNFEGKNYVFIQTAKQTFEIHQVQTGNSEDGFVEILNPELKDQSFVVKGAYTLLMTMKNSSEEE